MELVLRLQASDSLIDSYCKQYNEKYYVLKKTTSRLEVYKKDNFQDIFLQELEKEENILECLEIWISENAKPMIVRESIYPYGLKEEDQEYYELIRTLSDKKYLFQNELATLMEMKHFTRNPDVYNSVNMSCALFRKIMKSKEGYVPDKDTVFKLCIALHLTVEESDKLLSYAGYSFNPNAKKDIIVKYFIKEKKFDKSAQMKIDEFLDRYNEKPLFSNL